MTSEWKCTSCGAKLELTNKKNAVCPFCGTVNSRDKHTPKPGMIECVQCGEENPQESKFCSACGSELYFTCPKCAKLNPAESVHCPQCGANIAQEIQNWKIKQAKIQVEREVNRKKRQKIFTAILVLIFGVFLAFGLFALVRFGTQKIQNTKSTATAQVYFDNTPFIWQNESGRLTFFVDRHIMVAIDDYFGLGLHYLNHSGMDCDVDEGQIYVMDDLGNTYQDSYADSKTYPLTITNGSEGYTWFFVDQPLPADIKKLTVVIPDYCGTSSASIEVDLTSEWLNVEYFQSVN